jgi:hypothetical protein
MSESTDPRTGQQPAPGDPRDRGPRPHATGPDVFWGLLAAAIGGLTAVQFIGLAVALSRLPERPSTGGLLLGFVITVVWLLTVYWLTMGAWRRSVWGCPFHHRHDGPPAGRCVRHAMADHVGPDDPGDRAMLR